MHRQPRGKSCDIIHGLKENLRSDWSVHLSSDDSRSSHRQKTNSVKACLTCWKWTSWQKKYLLIFENPPKHISLRSGSGWEKNALNLKAGHSLDVRMDAAFPICAAKTNVGGQRAKASLFLASAPFSLQREDFSRSLNSSRPLYSISPFII